MNNSLFIFFLLFPVALFAQTQFISEGNGIEIDKAFYGLEGNVYYVAESGDDKNHGRKENAPFRTLQHASGLTQPGDIVYVMNGLYQNQKDEDILAIKRSGTESNWIMYAALAGHKPKLKVKAGDAISVHGAEYLIIQGFEMEGNNHEVTLDYAMAEKNSLHNKITNSSGVSVHPDWGTSNFSHHVIVRNCHIYHFSGNGIASHTADYVLIENNTIHHNAYYCPWAMSGISVFKNWNSDDYDGYKIVIRNNISYANRNHVPFFHSSEVVDDRHITDGNGIIVDATRESVKIADGKEFLIPYSGRTLIENNVTYFNGGRGIHVFKSDHVDVINNTSYHNSQTEDISGELGLAETDHVNVYNNILYPIKNHDSIHVYEAGSSVNIDYNLIYNTSKNSFTQAHNIIGLDPLFESTNSKIWEYDFRLKAGSPAIDRGHKRSVSKVDLKGVPRLANKKIDIGAFEFTGHTW